MDILIRYGFSIEEIKNMMDTNTELQNIKDQDILELINFLTSVGCHEEHIMNIFTCNPFVLNRDIDELKKLIDTLNKLKIKKLDNIFDINPYLLNMTNKEIETFYKENIDKGLTHKEIEKLLYKNISL